MNATYVVTIISSEKDKTGNLKSKTTICKNDEEMFELVQSAVNAGMTYEVQKGILTTVLTNVVSEKN